MDNYFKSLPIYKKIAYVLAGAIAVVPLLIIGISLILISSIHRLYEKLFKFDK